MKALRSLAFEGLFILWTALFGLVIPVLVGTGSPPKAVRLFSRIWSRGILAMLAVIVGLRYVQRGWENLPADPCLIIANHQSAWETLAALVLFPDVAIVTKHELLRIPVVGWYLRRSPMILIDRGKSSQALRQMAAQSRKALASGRSVLIFPEGTRRAVGDVVDFKRGVEFLYRTLDVPVAPIAVNSGLFWPPGRAVKKSGTIVVSCLPTIAAGLSACEFARTAMVLLQREKALLEMDDIL
ncbi:lysophospholipid acyltransferase family protein [Sphingomonas oryzagri]